MTYLGLTVEQWKAQLQHPTQQTPGKWVFDGVYLRSEIHGQQGQPVNIALIFGNGMSLGPEIPPEEQQANGRLLAAVPSMLENLRSIILHLFLTNAPEDLILQALSAWVEAQGVVDGK